MASEATHHEGGCACGEVRYRVQGPPLIVHCCHCTRCQRESGSAFAVNALIETARVELLAGQLAFVELPTDSGQGQRVARCPRCQVAIYSHYAYGRIAELVSFLRVGTLDVPERMPPDVHIFTASRRAWVQLPADARVFDGFYKAGEQWPASSLERRAALFESVAAKA